MTIGDHADLSAASKPLGEHSEPSDHATLRDRDRIVGLEAEVQTCKAKLAEFSSTDIFVAYKRIDVLEDEREALIDELHRSIIRMRESDADHEEHAKSLEGIIDSLRNDLRLMRESATWRVGSSVIAPISVVAGRIRRRS